MPRPPAHHATVHATHVPTLHRLAGWCLGLLIALMVLSSLLWPAQAKAQDTLALPAQFGQLDLAGHWHANPPGQVPLGAAQALAQFQANQFEHLPGNLGRGFVGEDVWLAFQVQLAPDSPPQSVVLGLQPAMLDSITVYTAQPGQAPVLAGQVGDQVPKAAQPLSTSLPAQAIALAPGVATTVLLHVHTSSTQAVMASLYQPSAFTDAQAHFHLFMGVLFTASGLMLVSALVLYAALRQLRYLSWAIYVLVTAGQWLMIDGQAFFWFNWADPTRINQLTTLLSIISLVVGAVFIAQMFEVRSIHRWLHRGLLGWAAAMAALAGIGLVLGMGQLVALAILAGLPVLVGLPVVVATQMARRVPVALWHGPLFLLYLLAVCAHTLSAMGWVPYNTATFFGWQVVGALNLVSIQVFMFLQLHREQQHLLSDQNRYLSEQVAQRTHSLAEALSASQSAQARFKHLVDNSVDVVWRLNPDTLSFDYVSPAASQHHGSQPRVHPFSRNMPPEERERLQDLVRARTTAFRAGELNENHVFFDEFLQADAHGGRVPIESSSRFVVDPATATLWLQGVSRDATERKRMQRQLEDNLLQLRQTDAAQRQLLTTLSHEFRTPAAQIKASLDSLRLIQRNNPPDIQKRLDNIGAAALRLRDLCTDLLTQERLQQHYTAAVKTPTDLCQLVHRVARMHPESARIQVHTPAVPLTLNADPVLLACALNNLLDNACAHASASITPITVTLQGGASNGTGATLRVADLGAGVADALQERLFDKHHSGSGQFTKGLGLAIVRDIATAHGGHVHAENNHPTGTVFVLALP